MYEVEPWEGGAADRSRDRRKRLAARPGRERRRYSPSTGRPPTRGARQRPDTAAASTYHACIEWIDRGRELDAIRAWFEARSLDLAVIERPNGTWRAVVMARGGTQGEAEYADGSCEIDAARRERTRQSTGNSEPHCPDSQRSLRARLCSSCSPRR